MLHRRCPTVGSVVRMRTRWAVAGALCSAVLIAVGTLVTAPARALEATPVGTPVGTPVAELHTQLEESRPADGAELVAPPNEVWLRFSTSVQLGLSAVTLTDGSRSFGTLALEYADGAERTQLRAVLTETLPPGAYTVSWQTAGPDSHVIDGELTFIVEGAPAGTPAATRGGAATGERAGTEAQSSGPQAGAEPGGPTDAAVGGGAAAQTGTDEPGHPGTDADGTGGEGAELSDAIAPLGLFSRWAYFLSIVLMMGMGAFRWVVIGAAQKRGEAEQVAAVLPRLRLFGFAVGGLAVTAALLRVVEQGRVLASAGTSALGLGAFLFGSPWAWDGGSSWQPLSSSSSGCGWSGRAGSRRAAGG